MNSQKTIIKRTDDDYIVIQEREYMGKKYMDVRIWVRNDKMEVIPTKKGVLIPLEILDYVINALKGENHEM